VVVCVPAVIAIAVRRRNIKKEKFQSKVGSSEPEEEEEEIA